MRLDEPKRDSPNGENAKVQHNVRRRNIGESGAPFIFRQAKQALLIRKGKRLPRLSLHAAGRLPSTLVRYCDRRDTFLLWDDDASSSLRHFLRTAHGTKKWRVSRVSLMAGR